MGGEHFPVIVYGFATEKRLENWKEYCFGTTGDPGIPVYSCFTTKTLPFDFTLPKSKKTDDFLEYAAKNGFEPRWMLALAGELELYFVENEAESDISGEGDEFNMQKNIQ